MNSDFHVSQKSLSTESLNELIIDSIQDIKGQNIVKLDLRQLEDAPADFFIICEGESNTQVRAISENVHRRLKEEARTLPSHMEGTRTALWVCLDYFSTVVHVFHPESRTYYELEELWGDAAFTEYESL